MLEQYDAQEIRCRMLGHPVTFHYCRTQGDGRLCRQILNCWFEFFPVETFIRERYGEEELQILLAPPRSKLTTLAELIERAKQTLDSPDE